MLKLDEPVVVKRVVLTESLAKYLQQDANDHTNGNVSLLIRNMLSKKYKVNKK